MVYEKNKHEIKVAGFPGVLFFQMPRKEILLTFSDGVFKFCGVKLVKAKAYSLGIIFLVGEVNK